MDSIAYSSHVNTRFFSSTETAEGRTGKEDTWKHSKILQNIQGNISLRETNLEPDTALNTTSYVEGSEQKQQHSLRLEREMDAGLSVCLCQKQGVRGSGGAAEARPWSHGKGKSHLCLNDGGWA